MATEKISQLPVGTVVSPTADYVPIIHATGNPGAPFVTQRVTPQTLGVTAGATTVGNLTPAATAGAGARNFVTDATATTFLSIVAGNGSHAVPVVSDGTNWLIG